MILPSARRALSGTSATRCGYLQRRPAAGFYEPGEPTAGLLHTGEPTEGLLHTGEPTAGLLHTREPTAGLLHTGEPTAVLLHTGEPTAGILITRNPNSWVSHGEDIGRFFLHTEEIQYSWFSPPDETARGINCRVFFNTARSRELFETPWDISWIFTLWGTNGWVLTHRGANS
jgi:hypothetical protein